MVTRPTPPTVPPAPSRADPATFSALADAFLPIFDLFKTYLEGGLDYDEELRDQTLAAAIAGNLAELDLSALAGFVIGVNTAGDSLEGVELVPPSLATETDAGIVEKATSGEGTTPVADKYPDAVVVEGMIEERNVGIDQTWQDVTGSRAVNTSYQNTTGKPIMVTLSCRASSSPNYSFGVSPTNGSFIEIGKDIPDATATSGYNAMNGGGGWVIPAGHYYKLTSNSSFQLWAELR